MFSLPENTKIVQAIQPRTTNGGISATNANYVSVKNYHKAFLVVSLTQAVAHATTVVLRKATGVGKMGALPPGDAALGTTVPIWLNDAVGTDDTLVKQTDAASQAVAADAVDKMIVFAIDPAALGGYDVVGFTVGDSSQATNFISALWVLVPARYAQATPPTAEAD